MAERVQAINPQCVLTLVDDFVSPENVAQVLPGPYPSSSIAPTRLRRRSP